MPENFPFTQVATGIPGAEGPMFDHRGRFFVVAPNQGSVLEIQPDGRRREHANTGGIPAGLMVDGQDRLWVADMKLGLCCVSPEGKVQRVVTTYEGQPIRGCNDLCFDPTGNLYFTAPAGSSIEKAVGEVFTRCATGRVVRLDGGFAFSNGIAVSGDGRTLIVAETDTKKLWAFDILGPGQVANRRVWAALSGDHHGGPDGLDFDVGGNLLATNWGGGWIEVFDSAGAPVERITLPFAKPSNLHFGGADGCDLWITEHTNHAVWKTRWRRPGLLALRR
ncbi:MAG: SMP-30/gluconolactonase/LRE family protein [Planctomycetes bacterium]|nr:SMP-30/gluconolactonase/LRE family protein [Planctomycetota bacterium]